MTASVTIHPTFDTETGEGEPVTLNLVSTLERQWSTSFRVTSGSSRNEKSMRCSFASFAPRIDSITRSGFEQKHLLTSQIATG